METKIGDTLPNGAIVLALGRMDLSPGKLDARAVLALTVNRNPHPFAVWGLLVVDNTTYSGDYYKTLAPALAAFHERVV